MTIQQHASFDSSAAELNATSKLVKAWESKNAKNAAKAGGVSLMALSLAACGGSSTTVTTPVVETPVVDTPVVDTPVVDAATSQAFTANLDTLAGGSGDDSFNGVFYADGGTGTTAFPGDSVDGGAGSDTLNISVAGASTAAVSINAIRTANVENLVVTNFDTNATGAQETTIDTSLMAGLTSVSLSASSALGDTVFSNMGAIVDASLANGSGDLNLAYTASVVTGTSDVQSLAVSNVVAGTFDAPKIESIEISSSTFKSTLTDVTSDTLKTLTVTGDKDLKVTNSIDFAATANGAVVDGTIDASAFTGKLDVTATTAQTVSVTGGSGNDTITLGGTLTKNDVIDGGAGEDTLSISATANRDFASHSISNIETVELGVDTNTLTAYNVKALDDTVTVGVKAVTDDKDVTITNLANSNTVKVTSDAANSLELGNVVTNLEDGTGLTDAMSVELVAKTDADQLLDLLTVDAAAESVTIANSGATGTGNEFTLTSLIADGAKTVTFTGAGNFITTLNQTGTNVTTTVDASGATGTFGFTEAVANDMTIKGSAGQNTIAMGTTLTNKDTIIGGASAKDSVSATVGTVTTATTGVFNISAVETLALTLTDGETATVDLSSTTGITNTTLAASGTNGDGVLNLTGLANAQKISTTDQGTNDYDGTLNLTLADATGTSDSVTIDLKNDSSSDNFTLTSTGIETLNISSAAAVAAHGIDVAGVDATKIVLTGGEAAVKLDLNQGTNKMNKALTEVDASAFLGDLVADASGTNSVGVDFKLGDLSITTTTGDAITGSGATTTDDSLTGNFAASDTTAEFTQFSAIESYNLTFGNAVAITAAANDGIGDGDNVVETVTMSGGNSLTTYANTTNAGAIDGTALTSFDASGLGGEISINVVGSRMDNLTIKGSTASAKDTVVYSAVNGLTATTGKAVTEGVETVALLTATAASTIDTSSMTGLKTFAVENDQNVTATNVAAGVDFALGLSDTAGVEDYTGTLTIKLADTSGSEDSVKISTVASGTDDDVNATLVMAGVETTNLAISADAAAADVQLSVAGVDSSKIVVTGGAAAEDLDLTKGGTTLLNASTTTVDASAFKGTLTVTSDTNTATTMLANGGAVATLTGSSGSDTFTIGKTAAVTHVIDGGTGSDTVNLTLNTGTTAMTSMEGVEVYNITADANAGAIVVTAFASKFFNDTMVQTVTLTGGKDTTTFDSGTDGVDALGTMTLFDASGFAGKINDLLFDADQLGATVTVKGGASTADLVTATFGNGQTVRMEGIETLAAAFTADATIDAGTYVSGLTKVTVSSDGLGAAIGTLSNLDAGVTVELITDEANDGLTIGRAITSGTESQSITLLANDAGEDVLFDMANVETLNIKMSTGSDNTDLNLTNFDMDTTGQTNSVVVTGAVNLDIVALSADTTSIDASAMTAGGVDVAGRTVATTALTFVGADAAAESVIMLNIADALDGGEKTAVADSLDINYGATLGGISVDLSAADQIVSMDGVTNGTVQTGFENVDLAGYTGFGSLIVGNDEANTIVGTAKIDNISGGAGADNITSGALADTVSGGDGIDTFVVSNTEADADTVTDFVHGATGDVLDVSGVLTLDAAAAQSQIAGGTFNVIAAASTAAVTHDTGDIVILEGTTAEVGTKTLVAAEFAASKAFEAVSANDNLLIVVADSDTGDSYIYEALDTGNTTLVAGELTLLATLTGVSAADATLFTAENFGL